MKNRERRDREREREKTRQDGRLMSASIIDANDNCLFAVTVFIFPDHLRLIVSLLKIKIVGLCIFIILLSRYSNML